MCHPMETIYLRMRVKSEALKICDTGWGTNNRITPEECEERLDVTETDIESIKKDIQKLELELNDLKLKINKKISIILIWSGYFLKEKKKMRRKIG